MTATPIPNCPMRPFVIVLSLAVAAQAAAAASLPPSPKVTLAAPPQAAPFSSHAVRLLPSPFKDGQDHAVKYLLSLEPDRFLANFRKESGLKPKAAQYGGWESQGVSGHCGGHFLSGCALAYAATGDARLLERVTYVVAELAECQQANGNGYVAAIPNGKKIYAEVAAGQIRSAGFDLNGGWVPNYTMHKLFAGLRDAYRLCGNTQALEVERKLGDWFEKNHASLTEVQMQQILACEHGGLNETFADLYADTGDERYLKLARRFQHHAILDPLARGEEILPGKHANTQIPKLVGMARLYELTGNPQDRAAAGFFWDRVVNHHSYITGGHCDHEHFGPPDKLNERLSDDTTETCNVYNMLKLTEHVFGWNPAANVADFQERALLNHLRGTQHPDGRVIYNLTLKPGGAKHYQTLYDSFTCCVGSGMENHVKYGEGIYYHNTNTLWVNLFIASELKWQERGVTVRQETRWPFGDSSAFTFACDQPQEFTLRLRHPHWAKDGIRVSINGEKFATASQPSSYVEIRRKWQAGDRVELHYPMSLRTEAMPDNANRLGVFYGPTLLAANLGPANDPAAVKANYLPVIVTDGKAAGEWVKPVSPAELKFKTSGVGKPRDVELEPFFSLHDRRHTVFFDVFSTAEWAAREAALRAEREREAALAARIVDELRIGEQQPEQDHQLQGERTSTGEAQGRKWRHAIDGGWFSFALKVEPALPNELQLTYWGGEIDNRVFDILVDGQKVATQRLKQNQPGRFFDIVHPLPADLTRGKDKVTVRLQAHPGAWAGGLFGAKMLRNGK